MWFLERTTQAKVLKLGLYVPWVGFYKSDVGIRKILIFAKETILNNSKIQYGHHFKTVFFPGKNQKFESYTLKICLMAFACDNVFVIRNLF